MKNVKTFESFLNEASNLTTKQQLMDVLNMLSDGWSTEEVANIILNAAKGKLDLSAYTGFNGTELSKETSYTK